MFYYFYIYFMKIYENFITDIFKKKTDIFELIKDEKLTLIEKYLKNGGDIEICNENGQTLFLYACYITSEKVIDLLIRYNADPLVKDYKNRTFKDYLKHSYSNVNSEESMNTYWYFLTKYPEKFYNYIMLKVNFLNDYITLFTPPKIYKMRFIDYLESKNNNIFKNTDKYNKYIKQLKIKEFNL